MTSKDLVEALALAMLSGTIILCVIALIAALALEVSFYGV